MGLTSIGQQKTPGRPVEITFGPNQGLPASIQPVVLIGHRGAGAASGSSGIANYDVVTIDNVGSIAGASAEAISKFGSGSELAKMVVAAVKAVNAGGVFPPLKCIPLASTDTDFGLGTNKALTVIDKVTAGYVVSPYVGDDGSTNVLTKALITEAQNMSGPQRVENQQFGTTAIAAKLNISTISSLNEYDTQNFLGVALRDLGAKGANPYSVGELAAAAGMMIAANDVPYNPMNGTNMPGVPAPLDSADYFSIGAGLESEAVLNRGWTPLKVKPTGDVAFVRTVTSRLTSDGSTPVTSYFDVQDFQVLYFFRESVYIRESQPDFTNVKASVEKAKALKSEITRIAQQFETDGMFQNVAQLAPQFVVQRNVQARDRFDCLWPVNVIPGLAVIANNIEAGTQFDTFTV